MSSVSVGKNSEYENPKQLYEELNETSRYSDLLNTEIDCLFDPNSYNEVSEANRREIEQRIGAAEKISGALQAWSHGPSNPESDILRRNDVPEVESLVEYTQDFLIDYFDSEEILLYRGFEGGEFNGRPEEFSDNDVISSNRIESWSLDPQVAERFMGSEGIMMKKQVPIDDIVACYLVHPSLQEYRSEKEFLVRNDEEEIDLDNLENLRSDYSIEDLMIDLEDSLNFLSR
jgi:hypothetical protein